MKRSILCVILLGITAWAFAEEVAKNLDPIKVNGALLHSISVAKVTSTIDDGTSIGTKREREKGTVFTGKRWVNTSKVNKSSFYGGEVSGEKMLEQYKEIMSEEMKSAGYSVEHGNALFDEAQKADTEFQIGAIVKAVNLRNLKKAFGKDAIECHFEEVEWQIFDRAKKEVVFKAKTNGYSQKPGLAVHDAALQAFQRSFRNLLASDSSVDALKK